MKIGFAKNDITPLVGVELCGFGPFLRRDSVDVHDPLWARAMAIEHNEQRLILVSCDLIGMPLAITNQVRSLVADRVDVREQAIIIFCSHTHSGPNPTTRVGWGERDPAYAEFLPLRVAKACVEAFNNLQSATLSHAEVPCEGIGVNREREKRKCELDHVLDPSWRPATPEWTDTTCHVIRADSENGPLGFISCFGCHPVVCCASTNLVHGDFCGVATNILEREHPGSVGLFIQGAHGDVNTCAVHQPEKESMKALDVIANRYADAVRVGLERAKLVHVDGIECHRMERTFSREPFDEEALLDKLNDTLANYTIDSTNEVLSGPDARRDVVLINSYREMIQRLEREQSLDKPTELVGVRIGPIHVLGSGFETFQAIKNDVLSQANDGITLVASLANDFLGYACDRDTVKRGGYAHHFAPFIVGSLPLANPHDELVDALLDVKREFS